METAAIQAVTDMAIAHKRDIEAELPGVRRDYRTLDLAARLMRRLNMPSIEDAFREEARQRVLRNRYAAMSSDVR